MNFSSTCKKTKTKIEDRTIFPTYFLMALFVKHCIDVKFHELIFCFHNKTARPLERLRPAPPPQWLRKRTSKTGGTPVGFRRTPSPPGFRTNVQRRSGRKHWHRCKWAPWNCRSDEVVTGGSREETYHGCLSETQNCDCVTSGPRCDKRSGLSANANASLYRMLPTNPRQHRSCCVTYIHASSLSEVSSHFKRQLGSF